jgi:long-chain acyl-CoA synthetase
VQPTLIYSSPVLWERFAAAVVGTLGSKDVPSLSSSVQKKLRKFIGCARLRVGFNSMSSIHVSTLQFYEALGIPLRSVLAKGSLAGIVTYNDGSDPHSLGVLFDGLASRIDVKTGELSIKGPSVCHSYYGESPFLSGAFFNTGDVVKLGSGNTIQFMGRLDRQFTLGKEIVHADAVELKLSSHAALSGAFVLPHPTSSIAAAILAVNREVVADAASKVAMSVEEYVSSTVFEKEMQDHVKAVNKTLPGHAVVQSYQILPREFSVKEGEITIHGCIVGAVCKLKLHSLIQKL